MELQAVGKHVIVCKIHESTRSEAGLYLPGSEGKHLLEAYVESRGNEVSEHIATGDRVIIDRYGGVPLQGDRISFKDDEILAVIRGEEAGDVYERH